MSLFGNYSEHPSDNRYTVFKYYRKDQFDHFKNSLLEHHIWFEEDQEQMEHGVQFLVAVKNKDLTQVKKLNLEAIGLNRERFIPNKILRYVILIISIIVMTLAVIGFIKSEILLN